MSTCDQALQMALDGWPVFPIVPRGKKPYAGEGVSVATVDTDQIVAWFDERPDMNYGVACAGSTVLDFDQKDGKNGVREWNREFGHEPPRTFSVLTPTGGLHLYYTDHPAGQRPLADGIDVRGKGGYVLGPGSSVAAGEYKIIRDMPAISCPGFLRKHLDIAHSGPVAAEMDALGDLDTDDAIARARQYLSNDAPRGDEGARDNTGFIVACALKDYGLSAGIIADLMLELWVYEATDDFGADEIVKLANQAHKSGRQAAGSDNPANEFDNVTDVLADLIADIESVPADRPDDDESWKRHLRYDPNKDFDAIPDQEWFVKDFIAPQDITAIIAPPGVGKSTFALSISIGLATGNLSHFGFEAPMGKRRTMFVSMEETQQQRDLRLWATTHHHGYPRHNLVDYLHMPDPSDRFVKYVRKTKEGKFVETKAMKEIEKACEHAEIDVLVLDPWVSLHDANENDNSEIQQVIGIFANLATRQNMAIVLIHHSRKSAMGVNDMAGSPDMARGAGALFGAIRNCATLLRLSTDETQALGLGEEKNEEGEVTQNLAETVFRWDRAKGNHVAPGKHTKYFQNVPVTRSTGATVGAIQKFDMDGHVARVRDQYAAQIVDVALAEMEGDRHFMLLKTAVAAVQMCPAFGALKDDAVKKAMQEMFAAGPAYANGCQVQLGPGKNGVKGVWVVDQKIAEPDAAGESDARPVTH